MIACRDCAVSRAHSFCSLDAATRAVMDEIKAGLAYARGDTVFVEGTPARSVYIVCSGSLKLLSASTQGKVLLTRFAMPGEMLGLAEAWAGTRYDCSAVAAEASSVSVIPSGTLQRFVRSYPAAAMRMTEALAEQYRNVHREARFLVFGGTSIERLARLLLEAQTPANATHEELAESIGSTRETLTRVLSELSRRGLVRRGRGETIVVDRDRLAAYLDAHAPVTAGGDAHAPAAAAGDLLMGTESWRAS